MIFDNTQTIINQTAHEILDGNKPDKTIPTNEEIDQVIEFFKMSNPEKAREIYLEPLIAKHGEKWVEMVVYAVLQTMISKTSKGE